MGCGHAQDHIDGTQIAVTAVASEHQRASLHAWKGAKHSLNETFEIVRLLKLSTAFAQSGGARLLVGERGFEPHEDLSGFCRGGGGHP